MRSDEREILKLLERLGGSALSIDDQQPQVNDILERLQKLEDAVGEQEALGEQPDRTFLTLCRRRLVEAQQLCFENLEAERQRRVSKRPSEPVKAEVVPEDPEKALFGNRKPEELEQSIYVSKTESMTKVLHRMHEMAQEEVMKGELNLLELDTSSKTLKELQHRYSAVDILLNGSRRLVRLLDEADKWDRRCMQASLGFLAFSFAYVVYRRVLRGPLALLFWVLLRLLGLSKWVYKARPSGTLAFNQAMETVLETALETAATTLDTVLETAGTVLETAGTAGTTLDTVLETTETLLETGAAETLLETTSTLG